MFAVTCGREGLLRTKTATSNVDHPSRKRGKHRKVQKDKQKRSKVSTRKQVKKIQKLKVNKKSRKVEKLKMAQESQKSRKVSTKSGERKKPPARTQEKPGLAPQVPDPIDSLEVEC